jgi:tetraacyldisaccharide 4'-kinase
MVVGNVVAGGAGKTPVVMALVRHLRQRGLRVGVISRGYGRRSRGCMEVLPDSRPEDVGDEPVLIRRSTGVPVMVAERRAQAAAALLANYPDTDVILADDGLQHAALHRDFELCVFDDRGIGNGLLLPAGPLREPWPRPVDMILHTGLKPAFAGFRAHRQLAPLAWQRDGSTKPLTALTAPDQPPLLALAAIARPDEFFDMLRANSLALAHTIALPDHYDFDSINTNEFKGYSVICTEKDAAKLWPKWPQALAVPLLLTLEPACLTRLDHWLNIHLPAKLSSSDGHSIT